MFRHLLGAAFACLLSTAAQTFVAIALVLLIPRGETRAQFMEPWPEAGRSPAGVTVTFASTSPFGMRDVDSSSAAPTTARATLFLPEDTAQPVPAVVMLHGAGGVLSSREMTYGAQYAAMGIAALVIDVFGARRDKAGSLVQRLISVTEAMALADAFAGLRYLDDDPRIDAGRVALVGFSYGGMATTYAAHEMGIIKTT